MSYFEARDDKRLLRLQQELAKQDLLIVDELDYVPLLKTSSELLVEIFSQRYERASTLVTSNLPFNEWMKIFGSERLTGALLGRLTHHVPILEMNSESYRLHQSKRSRKRSSSAWSPPVWPSFAPPLTRELLHDDRRWLQNLLTADVEATSVTPCRSDWPCTTSCRYRRRSRASDRTTCEMVLDGFSPRKDV